MSALGRWWRHSLATVALCVVLAAAGSAAAETPSARTVGVVCNVKVLSGKVPDVSSLEAWKRSFIKARMSDKEKALAIFNSEIAFQTADAPPMEYLQREDAVLDPIKLFNVYGYVTFGGVPAGVRSALVRYRGTGRNTLALANARIDADYKAPAGGFRPVQITYLWEEGGIDKKDIHVARKPRETYKITCQSKPVMKSIILELAKSR